jgi:hypothetical protein
MPASVKMKMPEQHGLEAWAKMLGDRENEVEVPLRVVRGPERSRSGDQFC